MFGNKGEGANSRVDRGAEVAEDPGNSSLLRRILMGTFSQRLGLKENQTQSQDEIEFVPVKCSVTAKKEFLAEDCGNLVPTYDVKPCPVKSEVSFCESVKDSVVHDRKSKCDLLEDTKDDISLTLNCDETLKIDKEEFCGELLDETEVENCDIIETEDNCVGADVTEATTEASPLVPSSISRVYEVWNSEKSVPMLCVEKQHTDRSADPLFIQKDTLQLAEIQCSKNLYICSLCNKHFAYKNDFIYHKNCGTEVNLSCVLCDVAHASKQMCKKDSSIQTSVSTEGTSHHQIPKPSTKASGVCSKSNSALLPNFDQPTVIEKHGKKVFSCSICNKSLNSKQSYIKHMHAHYGIKPYVCKFCNKSFVRYDSLKYHMYSHQGVKQYKCLVCDKSFAYNSALKTHQKNHLELKPHSCISCNKRYTHRWQLNMHMNSHSNEKSFKCKTCGKILANKDSLVRHAKTHSAHRPHTCAICKKSFELLLQLNRHTRICHETTYVEKDKKYICNICKKAFTSKTTLEDHINGIHAKEKAYICEICGKTFPYRNSLAIHLKIHSGQKPHVCEICNKSFVTFNVLSRHLRSSHETKPYKCSNCDESFFMLNSLKKHMKCHNKCPRLEKTVTPKTV